MAATDVAVGDAGDWKVERLQPDDAEALCPLQIEAGWNQVAADWEIFRELGTVHAARVDTRVVATAATLPYGPFAWISMVLVTGEQRRRQLGTRLLKRCVDALRAQGCVPVLDATPAGRPVDDPVTDCLPSLVQVTVWKMVPGLDLVVVSRPGF